MASESSDIPKNNFKAQAAIEYLLTYGWALLVIAIIASLLYLFITSPPSITPSSCAFSASVYCQDIIFSSNSVSSSVALFLTNTQPYAVIAPQIKANFSSGQVTGTCRPYFVLPGGDIICNVTTSQPMSQGSLASGVLFVSSLPCVSGNVLSCQQTSQRQTYLGNYNTHVAPMVSSNAITISLSVTNLTQATNINDRLTATVKLYGVPIPGATVNFTSNSVSASINPNSVSTNGNGKAASLISSSASGNVLVTAAFANVFVTNVITFSRVVSITFQLSLQTASNLCTSQNGGLSLLSIGTGAPTCSQFPLTEAYAPGSQFAYTFIYQGTGYLGASYIFNSISGCGLSTRSGTLTVPASNCNVTASYASTTTTSTTTVSTTTTITSCAGSVQPYLYCIGTRDVAPYTQIYYTSVSSTGVGAWTSTTNYPLAFWYESCATTSNYIYCVDSANTPYTQVYYAPISSTGIGAWTSTTSYVTQTHAGCSIYNNYIYCVGAIGGNENQVYYAPVSSTGVGAWIQSTNYPIANYHTGCSISGGYIYCVGGYVSSPYNQVYYAPLSTTGIGTWTATTSYPVAMNVAGCSINGNYIYCVGTGATVNMNEVYYAPISSTGIGAWTATTSYPVQMWLAGCNVYNNRIYCVGSAAGTGMLTYYAPISSTGIGAWTSSTGYPMIMDSGYCTMPGAGGGYLGGGGPSCSGATTSTTSTTSTTTTVHYVPITLTNSQSGATPAPFQQMLSVNSLKYNTYINSNWLNVEFTSGPSATGTVLQAWVETNALNSVKNTIVWVTLPSGIGGSGSNTIYMDFMPSNIMSSAGPTGEAPTLSASYAQKDNGRLTFNLYDNFMGTNLNTTMWSYDDLTNTIVNNGLILYHWYNPSTTAHSEIDSNYPFNPQTNVGDLYMYFNGVDFNSNYILATWYYSWAASQAEISVDSSAYVLANWNGAGESEAAIGGSTSTYNLYSIWQDSSNSYASLNYQTPQSLSGSYVYLNNAYLDVYDNFWDGVDHNINFYAKWIRIRALPPNNVQPTQSYGAVV